MPLVSPSRQRYPRQAPARVEKPVTPDPEAATAATPKGVYSPKSSAPANTPPSRNPTVVSAMRRKARRESRTESPRGSKRSLSPVFSLVAIEIPPISSTCWYMLVVFRLYVPEEKKPVGGWMGKPGDFLQKRVQNRPLRPQSGKRPELLRRKKKKTTREFSGGFPKDVAYSAPISRLGRNRAISGI